MGKNSVPKCQLFVAYIVQPNVCQLQLAEHFMNSAIGVQQFGRVLQHRSVSRAYTRQLASPRAIFQPAAMRK